MRRLGWLSLILVIAVAGASLAPQFAVAAGVVGSGTAGSCTNAAFTSALSGGGTVTFNCGGAATIVISEKTITADTTIDGADTITLSGNNANRLFTVSNGASLTLQNLTLKSGNAGASHEG